MFSEQRCKDRMTKKCKVGQIYDERTQSLSARLDRTVGDNIK